MSIHIPSTKIQCNLLSSYLTFFTETSLSQLSLILFLVVFYFETLILSLIFFYVFNASFIITSYFSIFEYSFLRSNVFSRIASYFASFASYTIIIFITHVRSIHLRIFFYYYLIFSYHFYLIVIWFKVLNITLLESLFN